MMTGQEIEQIPILPYSDSVFATPDGRVKVYNNAAALLDHERIDPDLLRESLRTDTLPCKANLAHQLEEGEPLRGHLESLYAKGVESAANGVNRLGADLTLKREHALLIPTFENLFNGHGISYMLFDGEDHRTGTSVLKLEDPETTVFCEALVDAEFTVHLPYTVFPVRNR